MFVVWFNFILGLSSFSFILECGIISMIIRFKEKKRKENLNLGLNCTTTYELTTIV